MKLYIFYFSPTGGTKHVSDIFCSVWDCEKAFVNLGDLDSDISLAGEDACVIAVPSFGGRFPQFLIPKFRHIRGNGAKAFLIAVYGNRAYEDTLAELNDTSRQQAIPPLRHSSHHPIGRQSLYRMRTVCQKMPGKRYPVRQPAKM